MPHGLEGNREMAHFRTSVDPQLFSEFSLRICRHLDSSHSSLSQGAAVLLKRLCSRFERLVTDEGDATPGGVERPRETLGRWLVRMTEDDVGGRGARVRTYHVKLRQLAIGRSQAIGLPCIYFEFERQDSTPKNDRRSDRHV